MIGDAHPPVVIAEIGINHEGSIDVAIALADSAINSLDTSDARFHPVIHYLVFPC